MLSGIDITIFQAPSSQAASVSKTSQFLFVDVIFKHLACLRLLCSESIITVLQ